MPEFWMDADSFITPYHGPYGFGIVPQFWDFLSAEAKQGVIASSEMLLDMELIPKDKKKQDALAKWAESLRGIMFLTPDEKVQTSYKSVLNWVQHNQQWGLHWKTVFLAGADPWIIAHATASGGRIVTFEKPEPRAHKVKIPDVAGRFGVKCIDVYAMLRELKANFGSGP